MSQPSKTASEEIKKFKEQESWDAFWEEFGNTIELSQENRPTLVGPLCCLTMPEATPVATTLPLIKRASTKDDSVATIQRESDYFSLALEHAFRGERVLLYMALIKVLSGKNQTLKFNDVAAVAALGGHEGIVDELIAIMQYPK